MRRKIIFLFLFFVGNAVLVSQDIHGLDNIVFNGKVKSIAYSYFTTNPDNSLGKSNPTKMKLSSIQYNKNGKKVQVLFYNYKLLLDKWYYIYDSLLMSKMLYDSKGNLQLKRKYFYDFENVVTEEEVYNNFNSLVWLYKNSYDFVGNKIQVDIYDARKIIYKTRIYKYNRENKIIENVLKDNKGKLIWRYLYEYDKQGKISKESKYDLQNQLFLSIDYLYDERGLLIRKAKRDFQKKMEEDKVFKYEVDEFGNWVKQTKIINNKPNSVILRNIKYYD